MSKFGAWVDKTYNKFSDLHHRGISWIGIDGLLNMETSALLTIFFMIFFPVMWAMIFSVVIVVGKCLFDKSRGHENELHDLICAVIGVLVGAMLGPAHGALTLF